MWINLTDDLLAIVAHRCPEVREIMKNFERDEVDERFFRVACQDTDEELEIDHDAVVSRGDDGAFVMSWVWISNEDAGIKTEDDDDEE